MAEEENGMMKMLMSTFKEYFQYCYEIAQVFYTKIIPNQIISVEIYVSYCSVSSSSLSVKENDMPEKIPNQYQ